SIQALLKVGTLRHHVADLQAQIISMVEHLYSVWLNATAHEEGDRVAAVFQAGHSLDCHYPALIRVEAANFEEEHAAWITLARDFAQSRYGCVIDGVEVARRYTIGDDQGVDAIVPHLVLHVLAHCAERGDEVEPSPVDTV